MTDTPPWASGPGELLQHGLSLLRPDSDLNRRLAMIAIDNAVELMIKTYLSLPRRVTGVSLSRKAYDEIADSFPSLLDAIEKHAAGRLAGVQLGDVEWYHRLRNQLYHQGSGLTVERKKVEVYAEVAKLLFRNLFGLELDMPAEPARDRIGSFFTAWVEVERLLARWMPIGPTGARVLAFPLPPSLVIPRAMQTAEDAHRLNRLRELRNRVVHEGVVPSEADVHAIQEWVDRLRAAPVEDRGDVS